MEIDLKVRWAMFKFILQQDKANHAFYGLLLYCFVALYDKDLALAIVVSVGALKEAYDHFFGGTVDKFDFVATAITPFILFIIQKLI